jgi:NitT/TauT family transport system ATP-binding protein
MTHALAFRNVDFAIGGKPILADISLTLPKGRVTCVIGPSGSGKTTLLRLAGGLSRPTAGAISVGGQPLSGPSRRIAIVFQDYGRALLPWRTAEANVALALEAMGVPRAERADQIAPLLKLVGLGGHADKFPSQFSGGMQQRLQIARCLAQRPDVLLMDEPFGALDAMTRQSLQDEVLRIQQERGTTILFITHDLEEALYLGDRVVALGANPGRIMREVDVPLPYPRNQLTTREHPDFLRLRRELFELVQGHH